MVAVFPPKCNQLPFSGPAVHGGGTFVCDVPVPVDRAIKLHAKVGLTHLAAGHLADVEYLEADCVIANKNGAMSLTAPIAGSANPTNSAALVAQTSEVCDVAFLSGGGAPGTAVWSINGLNARLTVTNAAILDDADVSVLVDAFYFGSI